MAALGCGLADKDDVTWITLVEQACPNQAAVDRYNTMSEIYLKLYPAPVSSMSELSVIRENGFAHAGRR